MSAPKKGTKLATVHTEACDVALQMLKGRPMVNKNGDLVLIDGKPIYEPCSAAAFREVREMLKDHGIDEEATEGSKILEVAKAARQYEDEADPFLVPDRLNRPKESNA
jgi:hypothetical protein